MTDTIELDPFLDDALSRRLRDLAIATPAALLRVERRSHRIRRPGAHHRRVRRVAGGLAALACAAVANGAAAYYAPAYAHVLGTAPGVGTIAEPVLRVAGLSAGEVTPLQDQGSAAGVTVTLAGGYADAVHTVLLLDIEGVPAGGPGITLSGPARRLGAVSLTDQFGATYRITGGEGIDVGPYPVFFEPLRGPAARVGARLTAHVTVVDPQNATLGEIDLHASLVGAGAASLAVPPSQTIAGTTYTIAGIEVSENVLEVRTVIRGALIDAGIGHTRIPPRSSAPAATCFPGVFLVTRSGRYQIPLYNPVNGGSTADVLDREHVLDETRIFARTEGGPVRVVVTGGGCAHAGGPPDKAPVLASWTISPG